MTTYYTTSTKKKRQAVAVVDTKMHETLYTVYFRIPKDDVLFALVPEGWRTAIAFKDRDMADKWVEALTKCGYEAEVVPYVCAATPADVDVDDDDDDDDDDDLDEDFDDVTEPSARIPARFTANAAAAAEHNLDPNDDSSVADDDWWR